MVRELHDDVLEPEELDGEYDGRLEGTLGGVESAYHYDQFDDPVTLAAWYAHALAVGHCFTDGNKRTALQVLDLVLNIHGIDIELPQEDIADVIEWVAAGDLERDDLIEYVLAVVEERG